MIIIIELYALLEEREISGIDNQLMDSQLADKSSSRLKHTQVCLVSDNYCSSGSHDETLVVSVARGSFSRWPWDSGGVQGGNVMGCCPVSTTLRCPQLCQKSWHILQEPRKTVSYRLVITSGHCRKDVSEK